MPYLAVFSFVLSIFTVFWPEDHVFIHSEFIDQCILDVVDQAYYPSCLRCILSEQPLLLASQHTRRHIEVYSFVSLPERDGYNIIKSHNRGIAECSLRWRIGRWPLPSPEHSR